MHGKDYLSFICNLVNSVKLGRNTSCDAFEMNPDRLYEGMDSYSEEGKKGIVFIMDNARIHHETNVR